MVDKLEEALKPFEELKFRCHDADHDCKDADCRLYDEYEHECLFKLYLPCDVHEAFINLEKQRDEDLINQMEKEEKRTIFTVVKR